MKPFMYVSGALLISLLTLMWQYGKLDKKYNETQTEMITAKMNNTTCKAMLEKQNKERALVDAELSKNMVELQHWKNKPDIIRYKYIYRELPKDLSNATCEDVVESIRNININEL